MFLGKGPKMIERKTPTIGRPPVGALGEGGKEEPLLNRKTQAQGGGAKERRKGQNTSYGSEMTFNDMQ